ncbi:MAG: 50S ribosomal protein L10 [Nocardiopsis sp. BM-2018]|nr:MAG: 50S ribosomal protein L10 [Nocardiopsis sp. BM-2018]
MANPRNVASVAQLRELLAGASTFFLVDYQGLSAGDLHKLRAQVRAAGGRLLVAKNSLLNVVLAEHGVEGFETTLTGPTALVLVGDDPVAPAKALTDYAKAHAKDLPAPKGGYLQGSVVGPEALAKIAKLPSREELLSQLVGVLSAPLSQLVGVLQAPPQNLVTVFNNYADKQKEA